ncbi:MAG: hypothetical protein AAGG59_00475, partial [Bacteroidota bacterium]
MEVVLALNKILFSNALKGILLLFEGFSRAPAINYKSGALFEIACQIIYYFLKRSLELTLMMRLPYPKLR